MAKGKNVADVADVVEADVVSKKVGKKAAKAAAGAAESAAQTQEQSASATAEQSATEGTKSKKGGKKAAKKAAASASEQEQSVAPQEVQGDSEKTEKTEKKEKFVPSIANFDKLIEDLKALMKASDEQHKNQMAEYKTIVGNLNSYRKLLDNQAKMDLARAEKKAKKQKAAEESKDGEPKKIGGFHKPQNIDAKLLKLIDLENGTQLSVTEISKYVLDYAEKNGIKNGGTITLNADLKKLLPDAGDTMKQNQILMYCKKAGLYSKPADS